jgi:hypothetical protein
MDPERDAARIEPWPIGLALALVTMMTIALGFYWIAVTHPDPPVGHAAAPAELERAPGRLGVEER